MSIRRSPETWRARAAALGCAWLACALPAGFAATLAAEREQLLGEQRALQARFDSEVAACHERFIVTACVDESNRQRRLALAPVRERLLQIDAAERQRRAEERRAELAAKQQLRDERMAAAQAAAQAASAASAPTPRQRMLPPAPLVHVPSDRAAREAQRQDAAAARARQAQERQAQGREQQARVARRQAERDAAKGPAQPLPAPPAASSAR